MWTGRIYAMCVKERERELFKQPKLECLLVLILVDNGWWKGPLILRKILRLFAIHECDDHFISILLLKFPFIARFCQFPFRKTMKFVSFHHFKKMSDTTPKQFVWIDRCPSTYEHIDQIHIKGSDNHSHTIDFVWTINFRVRPAFGFPRDRWNRACVDEPTRKFYNGPLFMCAMWVRASERASTQIVLLRFIGFWRTQQCTEGQNTNDNNNFMNWNNNGFYGLCFILFLFFPLLLPVCFALHPFSQFIVYCCVCRYRPYIILTWFFDDMSICSDIIIILFTFGLTFVPLDNFNKTMEHLKYGCVEIENQ